MKKTIVLISIIAVSFLIIGFRVAAAQTPQETLPTFATEAVGTGITYQGYLEDTNGPITDNCDFQFSIFGSADGTDQIGLTQTHPNEWVENGYFTVGYIDFGSNVFQGDGRYFEITVSCPSGSGSYSTLSPRQAIMPAPYALALPGLWTQQTSSSPNLIGGYSGNQVAIDVWGATIGGGGSDDWGPNRVTDRFGTIAGGVNNQVGNDLGMIDISDLAAIGGGGDNSAYGWASTISGGYSNTITNTANAATISGGQNNIITGDWTNTIGGGDSNTASGLWNATVSGGAQNTASESESTVSGGAENTASGVFSTVGGGYQNIASGFAAVVPGGYNNEANGSTSFAAGDDSHANHDGSFVWSDTTGPLSTTADNQFLINASGGVAINTDDPGGAGLAVSGGGAGNMYLGSKNDENQWRTYLGFNVFHDGSGWISNGDDSNNGGALMTTSWTNGDLTFFTYPNTGGDDKNVNLGSPEMAIYGSTGNVYIDNTLDIGENLDVSGNLEVGGNYSWQAGQNFLMQGSGDFSFDFQDADGNDDWHVWAPNSPILTVQNDGNVGINTSSPDYNLDVVGDINFTGDLYQNGALFSTDSKWSGSTDIYYNGGNVGIGDTTPSRPLSILSDAPFIRFSDSNDSAYDQWLIGFDGNASRFEIWEETNTPGNWDLHFSIAQDGLVTVDKIQITGGDLAEPFLMSDKVEPGIVVVIDPENPGQLRISTRANDRLVAGCVSGANGLDAGILMYQEIGNDVNAFPVALSGRVYCWADASYGAIQPGDLLTTSDTPGHLMVVKEFDQAQGAIAGKAMEGLENGQALILILVTLQ